MSKVRPCWDRELTTIVDIINTAALAYRDVIPADQRHEPYMPIEKLRADIELVPTDRSSALLETHWSIPRRQIETSVVLATPPFVDDELRP